MYCSYKNEAVGSGLSFIAPDITLRCITRIRTRLWALDSLLLHRTLLTVYYSYKNEAVGSGLSFIAPDITLRCITRTRTEAVGSGLSFIAPDITLRCITRTRTRLWALDSLLLHRTLHYGVLLVQERGCGLWTLFYCTGHYITVYYSYKNEAVGSGLSFIAPDVALQCITHVTTRLWALDSLLLHRTLHYGVLLV